ncbi:MAG: Glu/Leu/Phe/Val dehydrogenase dimerization domain-containing protein [Candidatus Omnitrophota bacterium]|jgi:glutamate dehydrogenase/leucine dehydrogenase
MQVDVRYNNDNFLNDGEGQLDNPVPKVAVTVEDSRSGFSGWLVIDSMIKEVSCGGLRVYPGVSAEEIKRLARTMTLKYGFSGMAVGGAKAGIRIESANIDALTKRRLLGSFGKQIFSFLNEGKYIAGSDLNTSQVEINSMLKDIGIRLPLYRRKTGKRSGFFTALSVMVSLEAAASFMRMNLSNSCLAVEGFGEVGSALCWLMSKKKGVRIAAISTTAGALYNPDGLDIDVLLQLRQKFGSDLIFNYGDAEVLTKEELFGLDVDILSPCAVQHSINDGNAFAVKAKIISAGANIPVTYSAEKALFKKGVVIIPHFIANCGGVIGNKLEVAGLSDTYIENFLRSKNSHRIISLLEKSRLTNKEPVFIAEDYSLRQFEIMRVLAERKSLKSTLRQSLVACLHNGVIPAKLSAIISPFYFERYFRNDIRF